MRPISTLMTRLVSRALRRSPGRERGFTLVETMIAMVLLLGGLLAVAPMFILAMKVSESSADLGSVGAIGVEQMEELRSRDWPSLTAGGDLDNNATGFFRTTAEGYIVRWSITDNASTPVTLKTIRVRVVSPREVMGLAKRVNLVSLRAQ